MTTGRHILRTLPSLRFVAINQSPSVPLLQLVATLASRGHDVTLLTGTLPNDQAPANVHAVIFGRYDATSLRRRLWSWLAFTGRTAAWLTHLPAEATVLACSNPPLLPHVAVAVASLRRFAVVARILDVYPNILTAAKIPGRRVLWGILATLHRWAYPRCAALFTLGDRMADLLVPYAGGQPIEVFPEWVTADSDLFLTIDKATARQRLGLPSDGTIVLFSGNVGLTHDVHAIAAVAGELSGAAIEFVVSAPRPDSLRLVFADCGNVTVIPSVSAEDYPQLLAAADVGLLSLRAGAEAASFPSRTLSYLAAGLPIIAITGQPGDLADLIERHGCGCIVAPNNPAELAATIRTFATDADLSRLCRLNARSAAAGYGADIWLNTLADRMESIAWQHVCSRDRRQT